MQAVDECRHQEGICENPCEWLAKQAAEKPNIGTNTSPMSERAIISATPANIAKPEKPIPCMVKRIVFTRTSGM